MEACSQMRSAHRLCIWVGFPCSGFPLSDVDLSGSAHHRLRTFGLCSMPHSVGVSSDPVGVQGVDHKGERHNPAQRCEENLLGLLRTWARLVNFKRSA
jgi:hypothetical protein